MLLFLPAADVSPSPYSNREIRMLTLLLPSPGCSAKAHILASPPRLQLAALVYFRGEPQLISNPLILRSRGVVFRALRGCLNPTRRASGQWSQAVGCSANQKLQITLQTTYCAMLELRGQTANIMAYLLNLCAHLAY